MIFFQDFHCPIGALRLIISGEKGFSELLGVLLDLIDLF